MEIEIGISALLLLSSAYMKRDACNGFLYPALREPPTALSMAFEQGSVPAMASGGLATSPL